MSGKYCNLCNTMWTNTHECGPYEKEPANTLRCEHSVHGYDCFTCYPTPKVESEAAPTMTLSKKVEAGTVITDKDVAEMIQQASTISAPSVGRQLVKLFDRGDILLKGLEVRIDQAILEAVAAETERCAKIAEGQWEYECSMIPEYRNPASPDYVDPKDTISWRAGQRIRARK